MAPDAVDGDAAGGDVAGGVVVVCANAAGAAISSAAMATDMRVIVKLHCRRGPWPL